MRNFATAMLMKFVGKLAGLALLVLALTLGGCQSTAKKREEARKAELKKQAKVNARQENTDVDFDAFLSRLRKAVAAHDVNTLASMMTADFGYSLNPDRSGDGVFQFWDENNLWPELQGILSEKFVKKQEYMVAPPQFADPSLNYDGYRAGIRRINGSWKFAYFVNG
jgi:predicted component of type VI protein secretion system